MKILKVVLAAVMFFTMCNMGYAYDDDSENSTGSALGGALMGGLLGTGVGAAIGSASGHAGTGAAIGAGVGALGGTLLSANQASKHKKASPAMEEEAPVSKDSTSVKKRIVREYDEEGNVISEREVAR